jgi:hypothetical protein
LYLTDRAAIHVPNRVDGRTGATETRIARADIKGVEIAPRTLGGNPLSGGSRRRLRLIRRDGQEVYLIANGVEEKVGRLAAWVEADRSE